MASTLANGIVDNNCYNNVTNMIGYNSIPYSTVADFNTGTGLEAHGLGGPNVNLTNPAGEDFSLQSDSQCRSLGAPGLGVTLDFAWNNYASPPSSGAYEFQ